MEKSFLEYYDFYEGVCKERLHLQGQNMQVMIVSNIVCMHVRVCLLLCVRLFTICFSTVTPFKQFQLSS